LNKIFDIILSEFNTNTLLPTTETKSKVG
jgi:hypothetical protein